MINWRKAVVLAAAIASLMMNMSVWGAEMPASYTFTTGTVKIETGQEWYKVHKALGKELASKTLPECINGGSVVTYIYDECEIRTSKNIKRKTIIDSIELKGTAVTEEGLALGQSSADVRVLYPDAKEEKGYYTVEQGDTRLKIDCGVENKKVLSITYEFTGKR
jgi:uncharacterized protein YjhX (UPF0386 family)